MHVSRLGGVCVIREHRLRVSCSLWARRQLGLGKVAKVTFSSVVLVELPLSVPGCVEGPGDPVMIHRAAALKELMVNQ